MRAHDGTNDGERGSDMGTWLSRNGLSSMFIVVMGVLVIAIILVSDRSTGVCGGDANFTTCLRNWVSAGGNIASVLVAVVALVIAWGQLRANAVMAALPVVNQRIITIKAGIFVAVTSTGHIERLADKLVEVADKLQRKTENLNLPDLSGAILVEWNAIVAQEPQVRRLAGDILDADLEERMGSIIQAHLSLETEAWTLIHYFKEYIASIDNGDSRISDFDRITSVNSRMIVAGDKIRRSVGQIRQLEELCRRKIKDLNDVAEDLGRMQYEAKVTRGKLLRAI